MGGETPAGTALTERAREMMAAIRNVKHRTVFNQNQIREQLTRLCDEQTPVDVLLNGGQTAYSSHLLDNHESKAGVWLDALAPPTTLVLGDSVKIRAQCCGRKIGFSSSVAAIGEHDGTVCYRLNRPKILTQTPERAHPRVPVPGEVAVFLLDMSATVIHALLQDISLGGIAARVVNPAHVDLQRGDQLASCTIRFSPHSVFQGRLQVRHVKHTEDAGVTFGARFLGLSEHHHRLLDDYITGWRTA